MKKTTLYFLGQILGSWWYRVIYPHKAINKENFPKKGKVIVCSNHLSMKDPVMLSLDTHRQIYYMAKTELFKGFVGMVLKMLGAFAVDRGAGDSSALDRCGEILQKEGVVGIFIEGTRSKDGKLGKPKSGAVMLAKQHNAPILPVCITTPSGQGAKPFQKIIVSYGKVILPEELGIQEGTGTEFRNASRLVMARIAEMRERDEKILWESKK